MSPPTSISPSGLPHLDQLTLRWTVGAVRSRGFEMLRLALCCAFQLFGGEPEYVVSVNSLDVEEAQQRTGELPPALAQKVRWRLSTRTDIPEVLRSAFSEDVIEGMGWKLVPLRLAPQRWELALDNDCILYGVPAALRSWLTTPGAALFAEDVDRALGIFDALCPPGNFNAGMRGLAPGIDLAPALARALADAAQLRGLEGGSRSSARGRNRRTGFASRRDVSAAAGRDRRRRAAGSAVLGAQHRGDALLALLATQPGARLMWRALHRHERRAHSLGLL